MFRTRFWMMLTVLILMLAPLLATAGYGLYLRSGPCAAAAAEQAGEFLAAPVTVGQVLPRDHASREFRDVTVWLPGEFHPLFSCRSVIVRIVDSRRIEIDLRDGQFQAWTQNWDHGTLQRLVALALEHDFRQIRLKTVRMENMSLLVRQEPLVLRADAVSGRMDLSADSGQLDLTCQGLNGAKAARPIRIHGRFRHGPRPLVEDLRISAERLPVATFAPAQARDPAAPAAIAPLAGSDDAENAGWFSGQIAYRQTQSASLAGAVTISGELVDVDVAALSRSTGRRGPAGRLSGTLDTAVIQGGHLQRLQGRLHLESLDLRGMPEITDLPAMGGSATLHLHEVRYEADRVLALLASGHVQDLDVAPLLARLGVGSMTGRLNGTLQRLKIVDGQVEELAGELRIVPPPGAAGTVDQSVLEAMVQHVARLPLPPMLPRKMQYVDLGLRFRGEDGLLHLGGIAGPEDRFVLVANLASLPVPLVPAPVEAIPLKGLSWEFFSHLQRLATPRVNWSGIPPTIEALIRR